MLREQFAHKGLDGGSAGGRAGLPQVGGCSPRLSCECILQIGGLNEVWGRHTVTMLVPRQTCQTSPPQAGGSLVGLCPREGHRGHLLVREVGCPVRAPPGGGPAQPRSCRERVRASLWRSQAGPEPIVLLREETGKTWGQPEGRATPGASLPLRLPGRAGRGTAAPFSKLPVAGCLTAKQDPGADGPCFCTSAQPGQQRRRRWHCPAGRRRGLGLPAGRGQEEAGTLSAWEVFIDFFFGHRGSTFSLKIIPGTDGCKLRGASYQVLSPRDLPQTWPWSAFLGRPFIQFLPTDHTIISFPMFFVCLFVLVCFFFAFQP